MPRHGLVGVSPKLHPLLNRAPPSTELEAACSAASPVMSPKGGVEREKEREKGEECDCVRGSEVKCHETCPWMELHSVYLSQLRPIGAQVFTAFAIRTRTYCTCYWEDTPPTPRAHVPPNQRAEHFIHHFEDMDGSMVL